MEYIKVRSMWDLNNIYQPQFVRHGFDTTAPIPEDRFPLIKSAIEAAINHPDFFKVILSSLEKLNK